MFQIAIDEKLYLRLLTVQDAEDLFQVTDANRAHLKEWLPFLDFTQKVEDSKSFIENSLAQFAANNGFQTGIYYENQLVGMIGLHKVDWTNRATSIGYWLAKDVNGKGIMTKATRAVLTYVFEYLKLERVDIRAATDNVKSRAIPERLGFVHEGTIRQAEWLYDHFVNHELYAMVRADYEKLQQGKNE